MNTIRASFAGLAGPSAEVSYGKGTSVEKLSLDIAEALGIMSNYAFRLEDRKGNVVTDITQLYGQHHVFLVVSKEIILLMPDKAAHVIKRRTLYLRPFIFFFISCAATELLFLSISLLPFMSGTRDLHIKIIWTMFFCSLGMSGALGCLTNYLVTDRYTGNKAIWITTLMSACVLCSCNLLCFFLDHHFRYFGSVDYPLYWHLRYPVIVVACYFNARMLYTEHGFQKLTQMGI